MMRSVLVLNHFAVPRGSPGGNRHVEMFSRLDGLALPDHCQRAEPLHRRGAGGGAGFEPVRTISYTANGWRRILNWAQLCGQCLPRRECASEGRRRLRLVSASARGSRGLADRRHPPSSLRARSA